MPQTLILAKSTTEANAYARHLGMDRFTYRAVRSAGSIRGIRNAEVHLLSSFLQRLDRHAIMSALRQARYLEVIYVDFVDGEIADGGEPEVDAREPISDELLDEAYAMHFEHEAARRFAEFRQTPETEALSAKVMEALEHVVTEALPEESDEPSGETEQGEDAAPDEEPKTNRRRSRCKDCGALHFRDEPCPSAEPADPMADDDFFA